MLHITTRTPTDIDAVSVFEADILKEKYMHQAFEFDTANNNKCRFCQYEDAGDRVKNRYTNHLQTIHNHLRPIHVVVIILPAATDKIRLRSYKDACDRARGTNP